MPPINDQLQLEVSDDLPGVTVMMTSQKAKLFMMMTTMLNL
jgi:hypothetical protein